MDDIARVGVVVVHWNAPQWLAACLGAFASSGGVDVKCVVVDNNSVEPVEVGNDGVDLIRLDLNRGYAGGANRGIEHLLGQPDPPDLLVVAAHDALPAPGCIKKLAEALTADPAAGLVGPVITAPGTSAGGVWRGWRSKMLSARALGSDSPAERDWLSGTLLAGRRSCWEDIHGFDDRLGSYVEDVDVCLRARDAGWNVMVVPAATASGQGSASSKVTVLRDVNEALLAMKRGGAVPFLRALATYLFWVLRGLLASVALGRSRERRLASFRHSVDHGRALIRVATDPRAVRDFRAGGRDFGSLRARPCR
jgi:N-acetylglucosaminyl-diphospho-decaprenol L-rhamnosyltransferase